MASLTSLREWGDVMSWLHFDTTWDKSLMAFGLATATPDVPPMLVENSACS